MTWPEWTNMLSWWQWAILAAAPPAIVALYFLKLKRRPVEVPSTYLWLKSIEDLHVNSIWQRLRRNLLLLLQLLVILLAAVALVRPHWRTMHLTGNRFILLVDNSASMQATDAQPSRLEEAKRRAGEMIDQMQSGEVAMIVSFADTARVEQTFTDNRRQLRESLAGIRPTQRPTSLVEALKVASGLANPGRGAEDTRDTRVAEALPAKLVIFSDGRCGSVKDFKLGNLDPVFVPIGQPEAANVGIVAFSVGRLENKSQQLQPFARLENFSAQPVTVSFELFRDDRSIDIDQIELPAGESRGVVFDPISDEEGVLRLKLTGGGGQLACDDQAWTVIQPPRRARVLLVTAGNEPLERVLSTHAAVELAEVRTESPDFLKKKTYRDLAAGGTFDLVIFDRCKPEQMPRSNTLFIGSLPPDGRWKAKAKTNVPQIIDADLSHPLLQWIDLGDVALLEGTPLAPPPGGRVLIDSDAGPMLAIAPRETFEDLVMGFVLIDDAVDAGGKPQKYIGTNWPICVSFTVFAFNTLGYLGGHGKPQDAGLVHPGMPLVLEAPEASAKVDVRTPDGRSLSVQRNPAGRLNFTDTEVLGCYEVQAAGKTCQRFVVNLFDREESNISLGPEPALKIGHVPIQGASGLEASHREIWRWVLLLGLAVLLGEWYIYNRRVRW